MDNHDELKIEKWVDDQMAELQTDTGWHANSDAAAARLIEKRHRAANYRRRVVLGGACILAVAIVFGISLRESGTEARLDTAPEFELENIAGGKTAAAEFKGKVTIVDMWATWCEPCLKEIPNFNKLQAAYAGCDVAVVGIAVESPYKDIAVKAREEGIQYRVLVGNDDVVSGFGGILGFPTTFVVNQDWKIDKSYMGLLRNKQQTISQDVDRLLGGDPACRVGL